MKIALSIMAHPSRKERAEQLSKELGNIPISFDNGNGIWWNRKNAMSMYSPDDDFICVLQDDAIPCKDFINKLHEIVKDKKAYSLYFGNRKATRQLAEKALKDGGVELTWLSWGVAIVLPTNIIPELIKYGDKLKKYDKHDDTKISKYLKKIGMMIYFPMPSIVDHDFHERSLMQIDTGERKAYKFIDNI
jgi:hypothetical protein